jgi:hypothetical protein
VEVPLPVRDEIVAKAKGKTYEEYVSSLDPTEVPILMTPPVNVGDVLTGSDGLRYGVYRVDPGVVQLFTVAQIVDGKYRPESGETAEFEYKIDATSESLEEKRVRPKTENTLSSILAPLAMMSSDKGEGTAMKEMFEAQRKAEDEAWQKIESVPLVTVELNRTNFEFRQS